MVLKSFIDFVKGLLREINFVFVTIIGPQDGFTDYSSIYNSRTKYSY